MLEGITYLPVFGKPFILYLGIVTFCLFVVAASIPLLRGKTRIRISYVWHVRMAGTAFIFGTCHALLGILAYV